MKVHSGVIAADVLSVPTEGRDVADVITDLRALAVFQGVPERIDAYEQKLRAVLDGPDAPQKVAARDALLYFGWVAEDFAKLPDGQAKQQTADLLLNILRAMECVWVADVRIVEPVLVTGAKLRRGGTKGNASKVTEAERQRAQWQKDAVAVWRAHPEWSALQVATRINSNRADYIRKQIRKPEK